MSRTGRPKKPQPTVEWFAPDMPGVAFKKNVVILSADEWQEIQKKLKILELIQAVLAANNQNRV